MSNFQLYKKAISATGTTTENEPVIKSDGASSNVMQWLSNNEASNITISEDGSNNLDLVVSAGNVSAGGNLTVNGGTVRISDNETDSTNKESHLISSQYLSAAESEGFMVLRMAANGADNHISIGGGHADVNAADLLRFYTAADTTTRTGTERMRIDSAGVITATTGTSGDTAGIAALAAGSIRLSNFSGGSAIPALIGKSNDSIGLEIVGATNNSNTSGDLVFNVRDNTNIDFSTTTTAAFKFTRWNVDLVTILRNGLATFSNGIAFSGQTDTSATGAAATGTTLDHYEEGTWTPTAWDTDTTQLTTSLALGTYVRVGKIVYCTYRITRNDAASLTGSLYFHGLPFTVQNNVTTKNIGVGSSWLPGDDVAGVNYALENTSNFIVQKNDASGYIATNLLGDGSEWYGALTYEADA